MVIEDETVRINPGLPTRIDLEDFVRAAAQAFCDQDLASCQAALGLARLAEGDFLAENRYDGWAEAPREAFRQEVLRLQRMTARLHEAAQDWEAAIEAYSQVLAQEPLDESACAGLMRAYAGSGQREAALRQYVHLESLLKAELGTRPSPEMSRLAFSLQAD